jgi:DNA polymerase-3 subunit alpha
MASRGVIRDVGRVLDIPLAQVDRIAKKVPQGPGASLDKALESDAEVRGLRDESDETKKLFEIGLKLEGLARHASTHAAGVVISDRPLTDYVPLYRNGDEITTQWQMEDIEKVGLLKMDFLGLKTLTILELGRKTVLEARGVAVDLEQLPLEDPATFKLLCSGDSLGVFQLESSGMRELLVRLRPDKFEDLIALLALYRPGPLGSGMVDMFVRRKHGEEPVEYRHEALRAILEETYGVIVYQEQVMLVANEIAGFSLNEADSLRKAMGKKKPEVMAKFKETFVEGAAARGFERKFAKELFETMEYFAGYGFNKSHSTAYALLTYRTAWLKANYPLEFLCAWLTCDMGVSDKIKEIVDESKRMGYRVLPPDVNRCRTGFSVEDGALRFGLGAIKGIGQRAADALVAERETGGPFRRIEDLCERLDETLWNKASLEALAKAGALECLGISRGAALARLETCLREAEAIRRDKKRGQKNLFGATVEPAAGGDAAPATAAAGSAPLPDLAEAERLALEKQALGFYLSGHPFERRGAFFSKLSGADTSLLRTLPPGSEVTLAGMITSVKVMNIKTGRNAGQKMAKFRLEDLVGAVQATVFARVYAETRERIVEDAIVFVHAKLDEQAEEPALLVEKIVPVEEVILERVGGLIVALDEATAVDERLGRLEGILTRHKGERPLLLEVPASEGRVRIRADRRFAVRVSEGLLDELADLVGSSALSFARL